MDQIVALDDVVFGDYFSETSQQTSCDETSVLKTTNPLKSKQLHKLKLGKWNQVRRLNNFIGNKSNLLKLILL